jgi:acetolactate synthase small subunit
MAGVGAVSSTQASAELIARNNLILKSTAQQTAQAIADANAKPVTSTAVEDFEAINQQVQDLIDQTKINNAGGVKEFQKETNDVKIDNNMTARDIGILRKNDSRLNLFSSLSAGDAVDVFKFKVSNTSFTKLGLLIADPTDKEQFHIQIFSKTSGILIADNDPEAREAYAAYQKLEAGTFELKQGDYVARISRMPGQDAQLKNDIQYAVQLTQGTYKNDFDTIEKGYSDSQDAFGFSTSLANNADQLLAQLGAASNFISSLPAIGTSATDKLTGALYDALF